MISQEDAEIIASAYGKKQGLSAFSVLYSVFDQSDQKPIWRVKLQFKDYLEAHELGFSGMATILVDATTGEPSSFYSL